MSVIVKGMEMPVMCRYCKFREPFIDYAYCHLAEMDMEYEESDNCRHPDCPLIELPPHGRLIDADELVRIWTGAQFYGSIKPIVDARPTIIEAEGET